MGTGSSRFHLTGDDIINECGREGHVQHLHILITGATSGIGLETGRVLACAGAKVYLMGRDPAKLQGVLETINGELQKQQQRLGGSVQGVLCDLSSLASVKKFAEQFVKQNTPLNVVVLNAGVINPRFIQTVDGLEQVMGVNHIAQAYLTQLLMPKLIASAPSRIVVVSAKLYLARPMNYQSLDNMNSDAKNAGKDWGLISSYQQSKLANVLFARALAARYGDKGVTAYSLHPGVIETNIAPDILWINMLKKFNRKKSLAEGVATTVYCTVKAGLENENGQYFDDSTVTNQASKWSDDEVNTFYEWTEKVIRERTANL